MTSQQQGSGGMALDTWAPKPEEESPGRLNLQAAGQKAEFDG